MNKRYIDFVPAKNSKGVRGRVATEMKPQASRSASAVGARGGAGSRGGVTGSGSRSGAVRAGSTGGAKAVARNTVQPRAARVVRTSVTAKTTATSTQTSNVKAVTPARDVHAERAPALGVIEDLSGKFVNTNVPKRPLSQGLEPVGFDTGAGVGAGAGTGAGAKEAKAKKIKSRGILRGVGKSAAVEKPVENSAKTAKETGIDGTKVAATFKTPKSPFINQGKVVKRPLSKNVYQKRIEIPKEEPKGPVTIIAKPEKDKHIGIIVTIIITIILGATAGTVAFLLLPK